MRKTNAAVDSESGISKISPALEVVTHSRLHRKFLLAESPTPQKLKEVEMIRVFGIIVLGQERGKIIVLCEL